MKKKDEIPHKRNIYFVKSILYMAIIKLKDESSINDLWSEFFDELYNYLSDELESRWNQ